MAGPYLHFEIVSCSCFSWQRLSWCCLSPFQFLPLSICVISWWVQLRNLPSFKRVWFYLYSWPQPDLVFHLLHLLSSCAFSPWPPHKFLGRVCSRDFGWVNWESVHKEQCSVSYMQLKLCPPIQFSRGQSQQFSIFWKGTLQWKHFTSGSNCSAAECFQRRKDLFISADCEPLSNAFSWKQYLLVRAVSSMLVSGSLPLLLLTVHLLVHKALTSDLHHCSTGYSDSGIANLDGSCPHNSFDRIYHTFFHRVWYSQAGFEHLPCPFQFCFTSVLLMLEQRR